MTESKYSGYQARTFWYTKFFGLPKTIHKTVMEDGETKLGVIEYGPAQSERLTRLHWTYATNGMSERRMPCEEEPHGDPRFRAELIAYSQSQAPWIVQLLSEMARYPFVHRSGFAATHTIPVSDPNPHLWDGYLLLSPPAEPEEINPLAVDIGIGDDWVFHLQVIGLKTPELDFAIEHGGEQFADDHVARLSRGRKLRSLLFLDEERDSVL